MKTHFTEDDIQIADKHMKICSPSLISREMQIKATMKYYYRPIRTVEIKNMDNTKCWKGCIETGSLIHCWWECKMA